MNLTREQEEIIEAVLDESFGEPTNKLIGVDSCAGSGKTTLLIEICNRLNTRKGLYLAYNKAIAVESSSKFPKGVECSTTHSFAYQNTIKNFGLKMGSFYWKSITERISYEYKLQVLDLMKEWCLSKYTNFLDFKAYKNQTPNNISEKIFDITHKYFKLMGSGKIPINHDGYLKFYHIMLANNKLRHRPFDIILLDESGDLNMVTFEIFMLLPAKRKIMVGDLAQNIYGFNHTVNCFNHAPSGTPILSMSQSFRCDKSIANRIEKFTHKYIDDKKNFKGIEYPKEDLVNIETVAYISRNNAQLIEKMIELNEKEVKYNLLRKADDIFELVLILLNINNDSLRITKGDYKYIQEDVDYFNSNFQLQMKHDHKPYPYIKELYKDEAGFKTAFHLIREHGPKEIFSAHRFAKQHEKDNTLHAITLGTGFGTKGSEFDKVYIMEDLNSSIQGAINDIEDIHDLSSYTEKQKQEFLLYYVACSRAKKQLLNATHLPR